MRELIINSTVINDEAECFIVAEIGHNHMGDVEIAKEMFRIANECGADAVKLQKRNNRTLYTREMYDKPYEHRNSYGKSYGEHREYLEFGLDEYQELKAYARELDITFFSTAFDFTSADFLAELNMPVYKIASGDLNNTPLMTYVAQFQKPMIISTGGGTMADVQRAYDAIMPINPQLAILQCTSGYPASFEDLNLRAIPTFRERFPNSVVGWSGHDSGIAMAIAAYVFGARIIEKHFTLNRASKGTDHAFSLERPGLRRMVRDLRRVRVASGDGIKRSFESEHEALIKMGKKIVAKQDMKAGTILRREDLAIISPADNGLPPYELEKVIGCTLAIDVAEDTAITFDILSNQAS